jgi:light-regulated signal transduction histidine kinase (bacteriophytochrome)
MQTLIGDLLSFSRVTHSASPFVETDLGSAARDVVVDLETRIAQTSGQVAIGALPVIQADPLQMRQLLQNLIGNGLKFHKPDLPPLVEVSARTYSITESERVERALPGTELCDLTVKDNGIGFDEKYLDRIFTAFQRLHGRGEYEGSGMGLAICRGIAERHTGTITGASRPGGGATFTVTLPVSRPGAGIDLSGVEAVASRGG